MALTHVLFALLSGAVALKTEVAAELADACIMPANFTISNFTTFVDTLDSSQNVTVFGFTDPSTSIDTTCQQNASSIPDIPAAGLVARYRCDNPVVEFIWQPSKLTLVETVCPSE
jgi:hypothetical protein